MTITDPLIGRQLGDYVIREVLGRGGMAHVYRGFDPNLERYAAVKVIDSSLLTGADEPEYRQRFQREARSIARLDHPNIVSVYQFGEYETLYYMAMAFIDGKDLGQILKENATGGILMPLGDVLQIISDIGAALDFAHARDVIHRDIKPSNIMVKPDGRAVLTDFGLALSVAEGTIGNTFGSAHYIAPEQAISSANAVPQSDLYALGVVMYQMLTGKVPFDDPSAMSVALKHLSDPPPSPRGYNPLLSKEVERVILKALDKEPSKRYSSGAAMARALEAALNKDALPGEHYAAVVGDSIPKPLMNGSQPAKLRIADSQVVASKAKLFTRTQELRRLQQRRRLTRVGVVVGAVALVLLLVVGLLVTNAINTNGDTTATPDGTSAALLGAELPTDTASPTVTDPESSTAIPTDDAGVVVVSAEPGEPTNTAQPPSATASETRATPIATNEAASATSTLAVTETSTHDANTVSTINYGVADDVPIINADAPIQLVYDRMALVLINQSSQIVSARNLEFSRPSPTLGVVDFTSNLWRTANLGTLGVGDCLIIWQNTLRDFQTPDYCRTREAWYAAGVPSRFWTAADSSLSFTVSRGGETLATCPVNAGVCGVYITPQDDADQ